MLVIPVNRCNPMCLIALAYDPLASNQLIVTANRDEFHARPTRRELLGRPAFDTAGRDLQGGGTWMGLTAGRFAALTNYTEPTPIHSPKPRGAT